MLIETLSITRLALFFGVTWVVTSVIVSIILLSILLATWLAAQLKRCPRLAVYGALAASLLACYLIEEGSALTVCTLTGLAVVCASVIFASAFRKASSLDLAFGANILGAVAGGFCEYASLIWGLRFLYLVALAFYGFSYFTAKSK